MNDEIAKGEKLLIEAIVRQAMMDYKDEPDKLRSALSTKWMLGLMQSAGFKDPMAFVEKAVRLARKKLAEKAKSA